MIAELLGGEVLLSELLNGGSFVKQADVFTSASTSIDVKGSAFSNSSTAPTAGSLAQLNGGSLYPSLLSANARSSLSIVAANINAGAVASFGFSDIVLAGDSDSNTTLLSLAGAARPIFTDLLDGEILSFELLSGDSPVSASFVSGAYKYSPFLAQSPSVVSFAAISDSNVAMLSSANADLSIVSGAFKHSPFSVSSPSSAEFDAGSDSNVALLSLAGAARPMFTELLGGEVLSFELLSGDSPVSVSFISGAYKHSPFSASSSSTLKFDAGGYFLSATTANAFSYTNLPSNEVKLGMLYADAKSSTSYSGIGVLRYAPKPDVLRPSEVRYMLHQHRMPCGR